jgi:hypothetical protein
MSIANGVTNVNLNPKLEPKYSDSIGNLINKLRETINVCNKNKYSLSKKHRIILIGDSNIEGYVCNLKSLLSSIYELYSVVKPGSSTSELKETAKEGQSTIP